MTVKENVIDGKKAIFKFYKDGSLYYETELGLIFEIPCIETGNGTFNAEEKALNLMKWIKKQIDINEKAQIECTC